MLGAGFGGLELSTRLSEGLGDEVEVVLVDQADGFVFGFSKLDVMFGRTTAAAVQHPYRDVLKPGVRFVHSAIRSIDPIERRVETDDGVLDGDVMVVALGADLHPALTPGLTEVGHEFYTVSGAFAGREVLERFDGGRVVVGVTSTPFKCPPAPSETALLVHDFLVERGLRDHSEVSLVMPLGRPIPPSPAASEALLEAFDERGIAWHPERIVRSLDPSRHVAVLADGDEMPFDLFLGVPVHRAPQVVAGLGAVRGRLDPRRLAHPRDGVPRRLRGRRRDQRRHPQGRGVRRAPGRRRGRAHHRQAPRARLLLDVRRPRDLLPRVRPRPGRPVEVTFLKGQPPAGEFEAASDLLAADKAEFGTSRIRRWFGREWSAY